jgi:hypothetical protein
MNKQARLPAAAFFQTRQGFVLAMRAKFTMEAREPWHEWMIVSRWGGEGEFLAIGRTFLRAAARQPAPIKLQPRETALAVLLPLPGANRSTFLMMQSKPDSLSVAGTFAPAHGYAYLQPSLQLLAEGHCVEHGVKAAVRCEATRVEWIGEYIEGSA